MSASDAKRAVVLVGFGSPEPDGVRPFLAEIFSDPIASPFARWRFFSKPLAFLMAGLLAGRSRGRYRSIAWARGTRETVHGLAKRLEGHIASEGREATRVVPAMRYGAPSLQGVLSSIAAEGIRELLVIPLFPHEAIATTGSIEAEVRRVSALPPCLGLRVRFSGRWYQKSDFVTSWTDAIRDALRPFPAGVRDRVHLLFTAHAIPVQHVTGRGDRYPEEVAESARLVDGALDRILPMSVAYQSAPPVGRWTGPTIEEELQGLKRQGQRDCLIAPIGFLYDNVETICDIDQEILPRAAEFGIERLRRVVPPVESPKLLDALESLVLEWERGP